MLFRRRAHLQAPSVKSTPLMSPIGVVRLTVQSAHIIPWSRLRGGSPDPFVEIGINEAEAVVKTSYQSHEFEPTWMETKYIVIHSLDDTLNLRLNDHHEHRRDALLGEARFDLSKLKEESAPGGLHLPLKRDEKQRGELLVDLIYYPAVQSDGASGNSRGIVSLHISGARRLDASNSGSVAQVSLGHDGAPVYTTHRLEHTSNPSWEAQHDFYCANRGACVITVKIVDVESVVGQLSVDVDDILDGGVEWWPLSGCRSGELKMKAGWIVVS
ncbi:C2 domain-containing protein [Lyophyllum atratum]|nr:C2 domain-containing protein [Lyophyllum atratum]